MTPLPILFRVLARYWLRHRAQALLSLLGVVVGVAVFAAIRVANHSALTAFSEGVTAFAGKATHRVFSPADQPVPDGVFARLVLSPAVQAATPYLENRVTLSTPEGDVPITLLGVDVFTEPPFGRIHFASSDGNPGTIPRELDSLGEATLTRFLSQPGAVMLPRQLAKRLHASPGDLLAAQVRGAERRLTVVGLFDPPVGRENAFARSAIADIATHQEFFGRQGGVDAVHLIVQPGRELEVRALLPPGLALETTGKQSDRVGNMAEAFQLNLEVLGLFAMVVATFVIFNAASFSVVQRKSTIAVLRSIGAPRWAVFAALLGEGLLLGAVGGSLGVFAGQGLATVMVRFTSATLYEIILGAAPANVVAHMDGETLVTGILLGMAFSGLGMLWPAVEGSRVAPMAAFRNATRSAGNSRLVLFWSLLGVVFIVTAALTSLPQQGSLAMGLFAGTALALGFAMFSPLALTGAGLVAAPLLGWLLGPAGRLAGRNLSRSMARNSLAMASLMVALTLALSVDITVRSFRQTFQVWLGQALNADIFVSSKIPHGPFPEQLLPALQKQNWVRRVAVLRQQHLTLAGRRVLVLALDGEALAHTTQLPVAVGTQAEAQAALGDGSILISESLSHHLGQSKGDSLEVPTPQGPRRYPIGAVMQNYTYPAGVLYFGKKEFARRFGDQTPLQVEIWLKPGVPVETALSAMERIPGGLETRTIANGEIRREALRLFDRSFAITDLMGSLAGFVAFVAVVSALAAMLEERTRLLGYTRAIGVSRRTLALSMGAEALLLSLTATVVSWAAGLAMSVVLVFVVNKRAFGWSLQFHPEEGSYFSYAAVAVVAALLGSAYPIFRATRRSIIATIREE